MSETLDELALKYQTDKGSQYHNYTRWYERHFRPFVGTGVTVLEIGICESKSLLMWREYFGPAARVVGLDYSAEYCTVAAGLGFEVICGKQEDPGIMALISHQVKPQIIIDDGGHQAAFQMASFDGLFPHLPQGGLYVIEDLHTAYWNWGGNLQPYLHRLADGATNHGVSSYGDLFYDAPGAAKLSPIDRNITAVHFYPSIVFVEKGDKTVR